MIQSISVSRVWGLKVFTDGGDLFGEVDDALILTNKIFGWRINATQESSIFKLLRGARGVIVPHQLVKAVGDVMIISRAAIPNIGEKTSIEFENDVGEDSE